MKLISIVGIGFSIGAVLGGAILVSSNPREGGAPGVASSDFNADRSQGAAQAAQPTNSMAQSSAAPGPSLYEVLVDAFAQSPEGLTIREMDALARISRAVEGRENQYLATLSTVAKSQGGITLREMMLIAGVEPAPLLGSVSKREANPDFSLTPSTPPSGRSGIWSDESASRRWMRQQDDAGGFRGASGARYKYDLGNTYSRMRYEMDPTAQLHDSISIDPRRDMDQSMGQYGGGIEP